MSFLLYLPLMLRKIHKSLIIHKLCDYLSIQNILISKPLFTNINWLLRFRRLPYIKNVGIYQQKQYQLVQLHGNHGSLTILPNDDFYVQLSLWLIGLLIASTNNR